MNSSPIQPRPGAVATDFRLRCAALGLRTWVIDQELQLQPEHSGATELDRWLTSHAVVSSLNSALEKWSTEASPGPVEGLPGLWLIPFVEQERLSKRSFVVACAHSTASIEPGRIEGVLGTGAEEADAIRSAIRRSGTWEPSQLPRLVACLEWCHDDLKLIGIQERAIDGFSRQVAESFEEISLVYRLCHSMNELVHPQKFVTLACQELQSTLNFKWVAARFINERGSARAMTDRLVVSGDAPVARDELASQTLKILVRLDSPAPLVLAASDHVLRSSDHAQLLVHPVMRDGRIVGALFAGDKEGHDWQVSSTDIKLIDAAAGYLRVLLDNAILYDDQQLMFVGTLEALTSSIDAKDPYTCGHSHRVAELASALARAHGLDDEHVERIRIAGIVHDVGKIGVPESVLCKTGRLTEEEFALIREHPEIGYQILKDIPQFDDLLPGVLHHHERYDGRGYPQKLKGEEIPLMARIIGLVDSFDAMSSNRTYRSAMPRDRVFEELHENAGTQFDPALVKSFQAVDLARYDELVLVHQTESAEGGLRIRRRGIAA